MEDKKKYLIQTKRISFRKMRDKENMKEKKINILCSAADIASQNIKEHLLRIGKWQLSDKLTNGWDGLLSVHENPTHRIIEIEGHHIYEDRIDERMKEAGYDTDLIIVASRHKSKDGRSVLTAHFTGNPDTADFGGRPKELSVAAPKMLCSILRKMEKMAKDTHYETNMESTHHGPTDLITPMVYAEIGSGEEQWGDPLAGEIVARAILEAQPVDVPVAIGFGGGHYAARQTELILNSNITFGHNFPDYQLSHVDRDMVIQAFNRSKADLVYFDRKSMSSKERQRLSEIIEELGYISLRENEIREMGDIPWELFIRLKEECDRLVPEGRLRINGIFRSSLEKIRHSTPDQYPDITTGELNEELIKESASADRKRTTEIFEQYSPIYVDNKNGTISNHILGIGEDTKTAMQTITNECIKILKEHYEIKYIPDENILYIISKRFDPIAAKELGIPPGPMLGELAKGNPVVVDGKRIEPEMVHKRKVREILLSN
ncbi:D-aminoacyl-tRNA deacylase [Methanolobus sp. WCC4]|uniref:D-aminoacyl-tRNA deacylase n=1 Tax=Methanolobus sp. WCC4 TaxID=3125784 RepID=UPI0030F69B1E